MEKKKITGQVQKISQLLKQKQVEKPQSPFVLKVAQKQSYYEDLLPAEGIKIVTSKSQEQISDFSSQNSELESGCSAKVLEEESPIQAARKHQQNSPIISHARQLKEIQIAAKNEKKASKIKINFQKSGIFAKRGTTNETSTVKGQSSLLKEEVKKDN